MSLKHKYLTKSGKELYSLYLKSLQEELWGWGCASVCSVDWVGWVLAWVACYHYCYCYYWNTILKNKMLSVYFYKNEKMFLIDLKCDLKKEPDLKSKCRLKLPEPVIPTFWIFLNHNVGEYASICVTLWIYLNMRET